MHGKYYSQHFVIIVLMKKDFVFGYINLVRYSIRNNYGFRAVYRFKSR